MYNDIINSILQRYGVNFDDGILKEHNKIVYSKVVRGFLSTNRVLIEQATGTGKSFVAMKLIKDTAINQCKKVLFVSPTDVIETGFRENCKKVLGDIDCLNTCLYAGLHKEVTNQYDLIIFDEVHRAGAPTWGENVKKIIANNPNAKVLGMTATLERADGVEIEKIIGVNGPVSRLTLVDAIEKGILPAPDYTLALVGFKDQLESFAKTEKDLMEQMKTATKAQRKEIENLLVDIALAKRKISESEQVHQILAKEFNTEKLKSGKFIVFCPQGNEDDVEENNLLKMEQMMQDAVNVWFKDVNSQVVTYAVHSKYGSEYNNQQIEQFEQDQSNRIKLLFSVNMLNEGKHVDDIDGVIMFRSTSSNIIYLQQLGRALSVGHNSQPKIFDFVANISNNNEITQVQSIAESVNNSLSSNQQEDNSANRESRNREFILKIDNLDTLQFIENIKMKVKNYCDCNLYRFNFEKFKEELLTYKETNGDLLVPQEYVNEEAGYNLGKKVSSVRRGNIKTTLEQKEELNRIGFVWDASRKFDYAKFKKELIIYKQGNGDLLVPRDYINEETGYNLGEKVSSMRSGKVNLTYDQKEELNAMGFVWDAKSFDFARFKEELLIYKEANGDLLVPYDYVNEKTDYKLGQQVISVRSRSTITTPDQKEELNKMGFVWDASREFDYAKFKEELSMYKEKNGDLLVPYNYKNEETGYKLGKQVSRVRNRDKMTTLAQKEELNAMGFVWDAKSFDFARFKEELLIYKEANGDLLVPYDYVNEKTDYKLGQQVSSVRSKDKMTTPEQKAELNEMGFVWKVRERKNRSKEKPIQFGDE